jgi:hypothetical protein
MSILKNPVYVYGTGLADGRPEVFPHGHTPRLYHS